MKYLLLNDIPAPWREKVFEFVHRDLGDKFHVAYCARNERRRLWTFPHGSHSKQFLRRFTYFRSGGERFFNPGIIPLLLKHRPKVVVIFGLKDPTMLLAFVTARLIRAKIVVFSDTWLERDRDIGRAQRLLRRVIFRYFGDIFLGASRKTLEMFQHYNPGIPQAAFFQSALCADNAFFLAALPKDSGSNRAFDLMFSGRIVARKNPLFLAEVAVALKRQMGRCKVLIIGEGDQVLKESLFRRLSEGGVEYSFAGFVAHDRLPEYYAQAKLLLLPTAADCWGVVINEAMVSGTPVITTEMTAAAGELVIHGENGFVLPLESGVWADHARSLLEDPVRLALFSRRARDKVAWYSFENAAQGIIDAIAYADGLRAGKQPCKDLTDAQSTCT